ncbi:MAG: hypothetical protein JWN24_4540 [Phycisphaerales bacterium]|nr:hypothetical protein [Phycisphaerales bacterium]
MNFSNHQPFELDDAQCDLLFSHLNDGPPPDEIFLAQLRNQTLARFTSAGRPKRPRRALRWIVTAASLAAVVAICTLLLNTPSKPAYGMADVPRLLQSASTLHVQAFRWAYGPDPQNPEFEKVSSIPMEYWIDMPNIRARTRSFMAWTVPATQPATNPAEKADHHLDGFENVVSGEMGMNVYHSRKQVSFEKRTLVDQRLEIRHLVHQSLNILSSDQLQAFAKVGQEQINGHGFDIWERIHDGTGFKLTADGKRKELKYTMRLRCWLAPDTGEVGRVEQWVRHDATGMWRPEYFMEKVERDVPIADEKFSLHPPDGYELTNTREKPYVNTLASRWTAPVDDRGVLVGYVALTLEGGTVIVGWGAEPPRPKEDAPKNETEARQRDERGRQRLRQILKDQQPLFAALKPGGPLPELPVVVPALRSSTQPYSAGPEITYTGYHLAFTRRDDRLIEWALYVPERKLTSPPPMQVYTLRVRGKGEPEPTDFNGLYGDPLQGQEEFDTFVRGSMAERSDDGAAPAAVTYDAVTKLADQLRSRQK